MPKISITSLAESDLLDIWLYIAQDNIAAADSFLDEIGNKCTLLSESPHIGREREELACRLRSYPVGKHIIFYRPTEHGVEIIRVLSAARDIDRLFP